MEKFIASEYARMNESLQAIAIKAANGLQKAERSCQAVQSSIRHLREFISDYAFKDDAEEICFFKELKPKFLKELIYFSELYHIESEKPVTGREIQEDYYKHIMEGMRLFFEKNRQFYTYYLAGKTHVDEMYFLRRSDTVDISPSEYLPDIDTRFSTVYSYKLSKILAYEDLNRYLQHAIHALYSSANQSAVERPKITWTDSKVDLVELVYAIHAKGAVNHGEADITVIAGAVGQAFGIDLGNVSSAFNQNIRIRKKNRTAGLQQLMDHLTRRMDDLDMHPR